MDRFLARGRGLRPVPLEGCGALLPGGGRTLHRAVDGVVARGSGDGWLLLRGAGARRVISIRRARPCGRARRSARSMRGSGSRATRGFGGGVLSSLSAVRLAGFYQRAILDRREGHAVFVAVAGRGATRPAVAGRGRGVVGFASGGGHAGRASRRREVETLYLLEDWRERGAGRRLMRAMGAQSARHGLPFGHAVGAARQPHALVLQPPGRARAADGRASAWAARRSSRPAMYGTRSRRCWRRPRRRRGVALRAPLPARPHTRRRRSGRATSTHQQQPRMPRSRCRIGARRVAPVAAAAEQQQQHD